MAQDAFGGAHTFEKLDKLEAYLDAYTKVFKNQNLTTTYFDAFAGTGEIPASREEFSLPLDEDGRAFINGSVQRALGLTLAFNRYVFVEKTKSKALELAALTEQFPDRSVSVVNDDANEALVSFCASTNWKKNRAVVFLDPFGNQVEWKTINVIAATEAIDLWYLFPAGLGVHRQISNDGSYDKDKEQSLNKIFGTNSWVQECIKEDHSMGDLFEPERVRRTKDATPNSITLFMIKRLKEVFKGGVLDEYLPLGSRGHHSFSLLFAWANPSPKAKKAGDIARAVMRSKRSGRTKRH